MKSEPFNGIYRGTSNGSTFSLKLKTSNGSVTGSMRDIEEAGVGSRIKGRMIDDQNIKGTQKDRRRKVKFIATEENGILLWEKKGLFLQSKLNGKERTIKFIKERASDTSSGVEQINSVNEHEQSVQQ